MPIDRSQYQIDLKTTADTSGVEKTIASALQAHEAFQLLRVSVADALGPVGELIHLLENSYARALSGATLSTSLLVRELQAVRSHTGEQIDKSTEPRDPFQGNRAQHLQPAQSANDSVEKNEAALDPRAQRQSAAGERQPLPGNADPRHAEENATADQTNRLHPADPSRAEAQAGAWIGGNAAPSADVRGSLTRTQQHISELNAYMRDHEGGHASSEEVGKLIELNDFLIGLHQNQAAQHGRLLDKIDAMMSRVQALEATQRNNRNGGPGS